MVMCHILTLGTVRNLSVMSKKILVISSISISTIVMLKNKWESLQGHI